MSQAPSSTSPVVSVGWLWIITTTFDRGRKQNLKSDVPGQGPRYSQDLKLYFQDLNLYLPRTLPREAPVGTHQFDLECACHCTENGTHGGFCKVIRLKSEGACFPWAQSLPYRPDSFLSLLQWPGDCELGFNIITLCFLFFLLKSLLLVRCCEIHGWKRYMSI